MVTLCFLTESKHVISVAWQTEMELFDVYFKRIRNKVRHGTMKLLD